MNKKLHFIAVALALLSAGAQAQQAGSWLGRVGVTNVNPHVTSGSLSAPSLPSTQVDVGDATQLGGGITYMLTDNVAIDVPLALPFKHTLSGAGAIGGAGKLGDVRSLPVTVLAQYRFMDANAQFRPYVGGGMTYAYHFKERSTGVLSALTGGSPANPTTFSVKDKAGVTAQIGGVMKLNDTWFIDGMVAKTWLKTTTTLSTGQTIDTKLDPISVSISVGMRFR